MTKKLVWRLKEQPTPDSLALMVQQGIISKNEAREILVSSEEIAERDKKSLEAEIKFLRELVATLSKDNVKIVETIKYVEKPYQKWDWYKPYEIYCGNGMSINYADSTGKMTFNSIKTF